MQTTQRGRKRQKNPTAWDTLKASVPYKSTVPSTRDEYSCPGNFPRDTIPDSSCAHSQSTPVFRLSGLRCQLCRRLRCEIRRGNPEFEVETRKPQTRKHAAAGEMSSRYGSSGHKRNASQHGVTKILTDGQFVAVLEYGPGRPLHTLATLQQTSSC
eukprot:234643-Rhodomonas_salina.2